MRELLSAHLVRAYDLLRTKFDIDFVRPDLYYGYTHADKFHEFHSVRDAFWTPDMAYSSQINGIYVPELTAHRDAEQVVFCFLHELSHAYTNQGNSKLSTSAIESMVKRDKAKGYVYLCLDEGLADYMAMVSCEQSGDPKLSEAGKNRRESLDEQLIEWIGSKEFRMMASMYGIKCDNVYWWKDVLFQYLSQTPERLNCHRYIVGHHFISNLGTVEVKEVISNPPKTIRELVYPEEYGR